jgi:putative hydrolase of the HAD superfamily
VLLDSFGTLVSMESPAPRLAAALGVPLESAERAFRAEIAYYVEHHLEGRDEASLSDLRDRCARVVWEALGEQAALLGLRGARAAMLDAIRFRAYPDAAPALRSLRRRGLRLVVASNWDCSLPEVLERAGLAGLVDGVVASALVGSGKPAPAVFEAALELAGCDPEQALHVGDSPSKDVAGAARAGIRPVLLDRGGARPDEVTDDAAGGAGAVARIESLDELPGLI